MRRSHLVAAVTATALVLVALADAPRPAAGSGNPHRLVLEVAGRDGTFNFAPAVVPSGGPFPNGPFQAVGDIYPNGTLRGDGSVPPGAVPIGLWSCMGFINGPYFTNTDFFFLYGQGQIVASQGSVVTDLRQPIVKAISGGTGWYRGVTGEEVWEHFAFPASTNFRSTFDLDQGDGN